VWRDEVIVDLRARAAIMVLGALAAAGSGSASDWRSAETAEEHERAFAVFVSRPDEPLTRYRARRRIEAQALGQRASMDVQVELDPESGFRWTVRSEDGSRSIIEKCFVRLLRAEADVHASGRAAASALTSDNYVFELAGPAPDGLVRVRARPRRREATLIDGAFLIAPDSADIVRVEGRLARSPSFWVPSVEVSRHFARVQGHRVVVRVESVARVRLVGHSRVVVTYDYEMINGDSIAPLAVATVLPSSPAATLSR
jgi:hypothetical protein